LFLPTPALYGGDSCSASYIIRNNSKTEVIGVEFSVKESAVVSAVSFDHSLIFQTANNHSHSFEVDLMSLSVDQIPFDVSSREHRSEAGVRSGDFIDDHMSSVEMENVLKSMKYTITGKLSPDCHALFIGRNISILKHELVMKVLMNEGVADPIIIVPLVLLPRPVNASFEASFPVIAEVIPMDNPLPVAYSVSVKKTECEFT
jgi:hypothetical protein